MIIWSRNCQQKGDTSYRKKEVIIRIRIVVVIDQSIVLNKVKASLIDDQSLFPLFKILIEKISFKVL